MLRDIEDPVDPRDVLQVIQYALELRHPGLTEIARAMLPVVAGLPAFQVNVLIDGVIAISLAAPAGVETFGLLGARIAYPMQQGANSVLDFGSRLMQFPLGVFGIALATAIFPALSSEAAQRALATLCRPKVRISIRTLPFGRMKSKAYPHGRSRSIDSAR